MSTYSTARSTLFVFKITFAIVICAVLLASLMALFPKMIHAEPLADGVYGYVMNESEEFVEGATIQIACGEGSWVNLAETDENDGYAFAGAGFDESMSFAGCSDGEVLRFRASAEGYPPSEGEPLGIIE